MFKENDQFQGFDINEDHLDESIDTLKSILNKEIDAMKTLLGESIGESKQIESDEKTELIRLSQSKAFSIWCIEQKLIADSDEPIESIPEEAFSSVLNEENGENELIYNPFTIWIWISVCFLSLAGIISFLSFLKFAS